VLGSLSFVTRDTSIVPSVNPSALASDTLVERRGLLMITVGLRFEHDKGRRPWDIREDGDGDLGWHP